VNDRQLMELNQDQLIVKQVLASLSTKGLAHIDSHMLIVQDLGIDSLNFIRLILEIESRVGRRVFNVETIASIKTVGDLYNLLYAH
jgi:acyl carrier protein